MTSRPSVVISNGRIVTPDDVLHGAIRLEDGEIEDVDVDPESSADVRIDAQGQTIMPGIVDFHGDDIEKHLFPRDGAKIDEHAALTATDRSNVSTGITTKFHAIPFEKDEEEGRTVELATSIAHTIDTTEDLVADHRLHARCEVTQDDALAAVTTVLSALTVDVVSITCSLPGKGQFSNQGEFVDWYGTNDGNARESEFTTEEARSLVEQRPEVIDGSLGQRISMVADRAQQAGAVLASHDDESATEVTGLSEEGVTISEYPTTLEAARLADDLDMVTIMGAPNLVRGGSLFDNLDSRTAANHDVLDALCADYHPPSLLAAPFVDTGEPLPKRVARVTSNPADAVGLTDRGRIEPGKRGDVLVVDPDPTPSVSYAFIAGQPVLRAGDVE